MESPNKQAVGPVRISIFSEGNAIKSLFGLVSAHVYKGVNRIGRATLEFAAGDMPAGENPESDDDTFAPGKVIRIEAGYGDWESPIFEGLVISHSFVVAGGNDAVLRIECRDYAFPATLARRNAVFEKKKESEAIQEICGKYAPLSPTVDATATTCNKLVQYYATDWDFVLSRADANGLVIVTEGKKMAVRKPDVGAAPALKVTYGIDLIEFKGELSAATQQGNVSARAWDAAAQKIVTTEAKKPSLNNQGAVAPDRLAKAVGVDQYSLQTDLTDKSALQAWADAQRLKAGLARIQGYCRFEGSAKALHGGTLELDGLGKRFNGTAYIGYVEHDIREGQWVTTAGLGLPFENITENPDVAAPTASGLLPGIHGLHIGKVTKIEEDPEKENRIQVEIPVIDSADKRVWARLGSPWASNSYGAFFIPDVGDEVILGFFNSDPCHPVILGSLYSSKQKPPYEIDRENQVRAICTKEKLKLEFNEEDQTITLQTPGKNLIRISDKEKGIQLTDQHKNKLVMNQDGILIESFKELTFKAKTNIVIDAGVNLDVKAKSNVGIKGSSIEAAAQNQVTVKGNAKAELSASGQTIVKGAMVMIN